MNYNFTIDDLTIRDVIDRLFSDATVVPHFPDVHTEIHGDKLTDGDLFMTWEEFLELPMSTVKSIGTKWNNTEIVFNMVPDFDEVATSDYNALFEE